LGPCFRRRALERGSLIVAEATAKELPLLNLTDALDLTMLIARKEPRRNPRVAVRWLLRYLEECNDATIEEAAMVAACLATLAGDRHRDAALRLRAMAEERLAVHELEALREVRAGRMGSVLGVRLAAYP
jgi:hypothetical protein